MQLNVSRIRQCLKEFNFHPIFTEELGWEHYTSHLNINIDNQDFTLTAISQKRGMATFNCTPPDNGHIPDYALRRKIEQRVAKSVHEHIIVYTDRDKTRQVWQWVRREAGKPTACREHIYHCNQPGDALIQKLQSLAFSLVEEEHLTIVDVTRRARAAFDVERVTKRFYDRFKSEHEVFLRFIKGIPDEELQRWYASVMLNRLMFIYFIQKKGFLDNNTNYLRDRLTRSKQRGKDCFYRDFLCPLFFEGFAKNESERSKASNQLLGKVPYLNGGIFQRHQIEELHGREIHIADTTFEKLFEFFDQYQWHLDERPLRQDNEINPDVLGYIFEKYINQKQMGAYYTKEDITEYISKNTVIPFLFDSARQKCKIAFEGENSIWRLLQSDPDRYIYDAVKKGVDLQLPEDIAMGLEDVSKRTEWNKPAPGGYALPTEIWREVVARRKRYEEVKIKLVNGEIHEINDFITYNLNIRQFAQDVIENCETPELLRAFWHAIEQVTILDPTCGSGAFLFAALNILEPFYEACLDRMHIFLDELESSGEKHRPEKFSDFKKILQRANQHPNLRYFILKSIIINNLYGVDIMEEAVEICKLRLFLKLVAQVEQVEKIEPLPDIDFNIRAGNTLVGYATYDEVKKAITSESSGQIKLQFDDTMKRIDEKAQDVERLFGHFRKQQTEIGGEVTPTDKQNLHNRLKILEDELNRYLSSEYGINPSHFSDKKDYEKRFSKWLSLHKPFHWFIEFYGIIKKGGFDVLIGNPPYVEYSKVRQDYTIRGYQTESCGNLYAFVMERSIRLARNIGLIGLIVPLSIVSTARMQAIQELIFSNIFYSWFSNYDVLPVKLFEGTKQTLTISLLWLGRNTSRKIFITKAQRWFSEERALLFQNLFYVQLDISRSSNGSYPKISHQVEKKLLQKFPRKSLGMYQDAGGKEILIHRIPRGVVKAVNFRPLFWNSIDGDKKSEDYKSYKFSRSVPYQLLIAVINSHLFFWYWYIFSDVYHCGFADVMSFPINLDIIQTEIIAKLNDLGVSLMNDYQEKSIVKTCEYKNTGMVKYQEFKPRLSKPIVDQIDRVLAQHYGFTDEELDFIINYDIKYRMGRDVEEDGE